MNDNDNLTWIRITDPTFKPSDYESVAAVLSSGWVSMGTNVSSVENLCGRLAGTAHAVAVWPHLAACLGCVLCVVSA